jgi:hypothetical protein
MPRIVLDLKEKLASRFAGLFSSGVMVAGRTGCSLRDFVCEQLGIPEDYLEQRIQTIFLNGKAVDDYEAALVTDGASLALSAAMPGLVGAVFRRGGFYAGLRSSVTHQSDDTAACAMDGTVTVKLFNLTVKELGPLLLANGVRVGGKDLQELFKQFADDFRSGCRQALLNDQPISVEELTTQLTAFDQVDLRIKEPSD